MQKDAVEQGPFLDRIEDTCARESLTEYTSEINFTVIFMLIPRVLEKPLFSRSMSPRSSFVLTFRYLNEF